jgi:hypothetical protein
MIVEKEAFRIGGRVMGINMPDAVIQNRNPGGRGGTVNIFWLTAAATEEE